MSFAGKVNFEVSILNDAFNAVLTKKPKLKENEETLLQVTEGSANHALVLMFFSLISDFQQPIGIFPSAGPMTSDLLR